MESIGDWIQLGIMTGTIVGVFITAYSLRKTVTNFKKQLQLNFFADYTKRYQEITLNFPESINEPDFSFDELPKEERDKTFRYMRAYFDLCSEEYDLWRNKYLEDRIWNEWKSGIAYAFSKTAFQKAWEIIKLDTIYYGEFAKMVEGMIKKSKGKNKIV